MLYTLSVVNIVLIVVLAIVMGILLQRPLSRALNWFLVFDGALMVFIFGLETELIHSETVGAALSGLAVQYLGQCGFLIAILGFAGEFVDVRIPRWIFALQGIVSVVIMAGILSAEDHPFFYTSMRIERDGSYPRIVCTPGILWMIHYVYFFLVFLVVIGLCLFRYRRSEYYHRRRILFFSAGLAILLGELVLKAAGLFGSYNPAGIALVGMVVMILIALLRYDYFDTMQLAFSNMLDLSSEGLVVMDPSRKILYRNEMAARLFPEIRTGMLLMDTKDLKDIIRAWNRDGKRIFEMQGGQWEVSKDRMKRNGRQEGTVVHFVNVTEHIAQEKQAREAREEHRQFMMQVSHELRSPLHVIAGADEMILRKCGDAEVQEFAGMIRDESRHMLDLIRDIIEITYYERSGVVLQPGAFSVRSFLERLADAYALRSERKGLAFSASWDGAAPSDHPDVLLYGDERKILQITDNLLSNALKYTETGGIELRVHLEEGETKPSATFRIAVRDTGIGIPASEQEKIFRKYQRGRDGIRVEAEGLGLGLAIVRDYVEAMHGTIRLDSAAGKGSTFTVLLPVQVEQAEKPDEPASGPAAEASSAVPDFRGRSVLIVEDREQNVVLLQHFLRDTGVRTEAAADGETALRLCREQAFDVLLIDYMMPGMDGPETLAAIRADEAGRNRETYAILFSANVIDYVEKTWEEKGFQDFLPKPVYPDQLTAALEKAFRSRTAGAADDAGAGQDEGSSGAGPGPAGADTRSPAAGPLPEGSPAGDPLLQALSHLGVDTEQGLSYADDDPEFYRALLEAAAARQTEEKQKLLALWKKIRDEAEEDTDWDEFTRIVHGLKGEFRGFGDTEGGDRFYALELAGKERQSAEIESVLPQAVSHWDAFVAIVQEYSSLRNAE